MPIEVNVGPPVLTINQGSTFMVTEQDGQIADAGELGVFANDTRFVSYYASSANGQPWVLLNSSATTYYAARIYLTNPALVTEDGTVARGTLGFVISRAVGEGIHEDLDITNYGLTTVRFNLEIALRSDFADIFEVKSRQFVRRGHIVTRWEEDINALHTAYTNRDFHRCFTYQLCNCTSLPNYANGRIIFEVALEAGATWHACCHYILVESDYVRAPIPECYQISSATEHLQQQWLAHATQLTTANEDVYRLYHQSVEDMGALRLYDHDFAPDVWLPAAGVPWFVGIFGRDSLVVSLQNMLVNAGFARGALKKLAELQATKLDDWRDAQPGKMPHELRCGELAHFKKTPHTPYYGTADATPLYLIVLHEAWKWMGDDSLLREHREVALRCLEWIDQYGDLDGDGFQEYRSRSSQGLENQSWKDSGDAIVYPDGSQVKPPKALCELQGYVFDAWMRMAEVFAALKEDERANVLRTKAAQLRARFEERFWCEDIGFYALALDPDKQPVRTIASNAGHCLWSGIASPEHAARVVERLMQPDMWSGCGIRTLSAHNPAYNPYSYQLGSIWPHDNGIIALGFKRYGFTAEAARVARGISEAASYFSSYRLPELYTGIELQPGMFPVQYPEANVPQAWAAGSVFHLLQAILGLQADAPNNRLYVDPDLPEWLPEITLHHLAIGNARVNLRFWRESERTRWDASVQAGDINVQQQSWQPFTYSTAPMPKEPPSELNLR